MLVSVMKKNILLILSIFLLVFSCEKDEDPSITINEKDISVSDVRTTQIVTFTSNIDWTAKSSASWCTLSQTSGDASTSRIIIIVEANDTFSDRSSTITISGGGLSKSITLTQAANLGLIAVSDKFDLSNDASTIEVQIDANVELEITTSDDWITRNTTRALTSNKFYFDIAQNKSYDNRSGSIVIKQKNGTLSTTIKVYQSQEDAIILSDKIQEISSEKQTLEIELKTNVEFEVLIPEAATNWVSYTGTRALRTETLMLNIAANEKLNAARTTKVYVKNKATNLRDTLTITQDKPAVLATISTIKASDILGSRAKSGGTITSDGRADIIAKGVCWSTTENPTIQNSKTEDGVGAGDFVTDISGLENFTKYYARAYATNRMGTSYGNQISFTTLTEVAAPVINPKGGTYGEAQTITMTCATGGAKIRFTQDGSDPTQTSTLYSGGFVIDKSMTIKAKAFKADLIDSPITTETYVINLGLQIIIGNSNTVQHLDASENFIFQLNNLVDKEVFFVFSNKNEKREVVLPKLKSNVAKSTAMKSRSSGEPNTFVVSGKPSITKFNNNPPKLTKSEVNKSQYQQQMVSNRVKFEVGMSEDFFDDQGTPVKSTVRKIISAHGKNLHMWVANNCWGPTSTKKRHVTQTMIDEFAPKFLNEGADNDIYEWVTNAAGEPWGPTGYSDLIAETDDIHIWLTDIDDDNKTTGEITLGYYYSRDNFIKDTDHNILKYSNEKLMFTIDAVLFGKKANEEWSVSDYWPMECISTLSHEFTHMIYFYQKGIVSDQKSNTAINEMCAQCVEDLVSNKILVNGPRGVPYGTSGAGNNGNKNGRIPDYNSNNDLNLLEWSEDKNESLINYSKTYTLGAYLMRNYGGANLIKELIQNNTTGTASIVNAVNTNGGGVQDFGDILQRFGAANLLSNQTTSTAGYYFNSGGWSTSTVNGIEYKLGSINLYNYAPVPYIFNTLPEKQKPNSNILYRAGSNLNGKQEWQFNEMNANTKLTVVIK